jgi:hypothetical protein
MRTGPCYPRCVCGAHRLLTTLKGAEGGAAPVACQLAVDFEAWQGDEQPCGDGLFCDAFEHWQGDEQPLLMGGSVL